MAPCTKKLRTNVPMSKLVMTNWDSSAVCLKVRVAAVSCAYFLRAEFRTRYCESTKPSTSGE